MLPGVAADLPPGSAEKAYLDHPYEPQRVRVLLVEDEALIAAMVEDMVFVDLSNQRLGFDSSPSNFGARKSEFDLGAGVWTIPSERMKAEGFDTLELRNAKAPVAELQR